MFGHKVSARLSQWSAMRLIGQPGPADIPCAECAVSHLPHTSGIPYREQQCLSHERLSTQMGTNLTSHGARR